MEPIGSNLVLKVRGSAASVDPTSLPQFPGRKSQSRRDRFCDDRFRPPVIETASGGTTFGFGLNQWGSGKTIWWHYRRLRRWGQLSGRDFNSCWYHGKYNSTKQPLARVLSMTIEQTTKIDGMGLDRAANEIVLLISDHMLWQDKSHHVAALEKKLGAYLEFISSQQHLELVPEARDWPVRIKLVHENEPTASAEGILKAVKDQLQTMNIRFSYAGLPDGY